MSLRSNILNRAKSEVFDVLIIGGGINGASSAAALSAIGIKVALVDQNDFASFTSQESSNLVWGGIKYLETGEVGLVNKLCKSRNHLIKSYPSSVKEIRFFTTLAKGFRMPRLFLYIGACIYWLLGRGFTRPPKLLSLKDINNKEPVVNTEDAVGGIEYSDAYLIDNDARFVFGFIREAMDHGAVCLNYLKLENAERLSGVWAGHVRDVVSGEAFKINARALINATGPFADKLNGVLHQKTKNQHLFSKGIHLIVPQITKSKNVLTFFADDGRLFFIIPMGRRSCIGTTDTRVENLPPHATKEDRQFILDNINKRLNLTKPLSISDIISERCGVRPLVATSSSDSGDWTSLSRKHAMESDNDRMLITIFGGKLTDCLNIGDEITALVRSFGITPTHPDAKWYGEPPEEEKNRFFHQASLMNLDGLTAKGSPEPLSIRLWRRYGRRAFRLLNDIQRDPRMSDVVIDGTEYIKCELHLAKEQEMVVNLEDFLRRRSKIALINSKEKLLKSNGLLEACKILFGGEGRSKFDDYFLPQEND